MQELTDHHPDRSLSAIYRGTVRHRRFTPVKHAFTYRIAMPMLDLDHADSELALRPLLGDGRWAIGAFWRGDYVGGNSPDSELTTAQHLKHHIAEEVADQTGVLVSGKMLLLTHLRYWGFMMNPIAIFYCYDDSGELVAVALQVTNTPWREKVLYAFPATSPKRTLTTRFDKSMHVSPFNPMDMQYLCRLQAPGKRLFFHLENHRSSGSEPDRHTDATMLFDRTPLSRAALVKLSISQPAMTAKVGFGIYWQALRLWLSGAPVYDHPDTIQAEGSGQNQAAIDLSLQFKQTKSET